jgi:isopentenyl diphosphate isomerase/L-lactate dehydrogenase-like FMN-dependent dehydrogenase
MGAEGTAFYMEQIKQELQKAMVLTGCTKIEDITADIIREIR